MEVVKMKICIDPGHSGPYEPGACVGGVTEAAINMAISKNVGEILFWLGYEVIFTRIGDIEQDDLEFRAQLANNEDADLFVSIHCNSAESPVANGVEIYHHPDSEEGMTLAVLIAGVLPESTTLENRGVKEENFAVLRLTNMPAVLVECGFLSSESDRQILTDERQQTAIALGIAAGINRYFILGVEK